MGRTGAPISIVALDLASAVNNFVQDGHIKGDREARQQQVSNIAEKIRSADIVACEPVWNPMWWLAAAIPSPLATRVDTLCISQQLDVFEFSSQHDVDLANLGWEPAAFVLTTVVSLHAGTATLDAGSKAISPDKHMSERFRWYGKIISMSEEHTVVEADDLKVGDRLFLMPQHTCTTAYLYDHALVRTSAGPWEQRQQLGSKR
jgi:D-serine deaminase-like pyridoxal phosphate-dependent protein